jgi:hypothetical protein
MLFIWALHTADSCNGPALIILGTSSRRSKEGKVWVCSCFCFCFCFVENPNGFYTYPGPFHSA